MVLTELLQRKLHEPSLLWRLLPPINTQPNFVLIAILFPSLPTWNSLYNKRPVWSVPINIVTPKSFSRENSIPCKCGYLWFISGVSYLLKVISRLFTSQADSFDESFIADELALTETIAESIWSDFDKALVTGYCCWLPSRFNLLEIYWVWFTVQECIRFYWKRSIW